MQDSYSPPNQWSFFPLGSSLRQMASGTVYVATCETYWKWVLRPLQKRGVIIRFTTFNLKLCQFYVSFHVFSSISAASSRSSSSFASGGALPTSTNPVIIQGLQVVALDPMVF